jgi:hypothetical protein
MKARDGMRSDVVAKVAGAVEIDSSLRRLEADRRPR